MLKQSMQTPVGNVSVVDEAPEANPLPAHASIILRFLNLVMEARKWLMAHHLDDVVIDQSNRNYTVNDEHVSLDMKKCKTSLNRGTSEVVLVQVVETAFNTQYIEPAWHNPAHC